MLSRTVFLFKRKAAASSSSAFELFTAQVAPSLPPQHCQRFAVALYNLTTPRFGKEVNKDRTSTAISLYKRYYGGVITLSKQLGKATAPKPQAKLTKNGATPTSSQKRTKRTKQKPTRSTAKTVKTAKTKKPRVIRNRAAIKSSKKMTRAKKTRKQRGKSQ